MPRPARPLRCSAPARWRRLGAAAILLAIAAAAVLHADAPGKDALAGWDAYVAAVEKRVDAELAAPSGPFLVLDGFERGTREEALAQLRKDEVFVTRMPPPGAASAHVHDALLHHWLGAVLVRGSTVERLIAFVQDYDHHAGVYADVIAARTLARDGDLFKIFLKLQRSRFTIDVFYDTEHEVVYRSHGADRASSRSRATKITELERAGSPQERAKTSEEDRGYLWRLNSYWRFRAVPEGVIVECESVSLSRTVPWLVRVVVGRFIDSVPRDSLRQTLTDMRRGVLGRR